MGDGYLIKTWWRGATPEQVLQPSTQSGAPTCMSAE